LKRTIVVLFSALLLFSAFAFSGCRSGGFSREKAAVIIADTLGFEGGGSLPSDVQSGGKDTDAVKVCVSRNIFDVYGSLYKFRPSDKLTNIELAKITVNSYAALKFMRAENLEPGTKREVGDIGTLSFEDKWYIYAALEYGFVGLDGTKFNPQETVNEAKLKEALGRVKDKAGAQGTNYQTYSNNLQANFSTVPVRDAPVSEQITVYNATGNSKFDKLLVASVQGLANRDKIQMFIDNVQQGNGQRWIMDFARKNEHFQSYKEISGLNNLLSEFGSIIKKAVVYDVERMYTINAAVSLAAVEGAVVIQESYIDRIKEVSPDAEIIRIADFNLSSQYTAQKWAFENCFPFMRRDIIEWAFYGGNQTEYQRDYVIQHKIPTVWAPGKNSDDHENRIVDLLSTIMQSYPVNIPLLGFQVAASAVEGMVEEDALVWCGEYGKYSVVFDSGGNLSVFSALKVSDDKLKFNQNTAVAPELNPGKKYVAFNLSYGGESPAYMQLVFNRFQWSSSERGTFSYTYNYSIATLELMPVLAQKFIEEATAFDYFYCSMTGLGVATPMLGYGAKGAVSNGTQYMTQDDVLADYFKKTNDKCKQYGLKGIGYYSSVERGWTGADYSHLKNKIVPHMPDIDFVVADKFKIGNLPEYIVDLGGGKTLYHLSMLDEAMQVSFGDVTNTSKDIAARDYLVNEIVNSEGQFLMCAVGAWFYGPSRIKMAIDKLNADYPGQYVFVTMHQLNALINS